MNRITETQEPLISVVIPVYNVEAWLAECLDSAIGQTLQNFEIICVNDGSTDSSLQILKEYAERDSRVQILSQENKGLSEARNVGARAAQGKYLYFLDSDDMIEPDTLQLCTDRMEAQGLEYVCFNMTGFGEDPDSAKAAENLNQSYFSRVLNEQKLYTGQELFRELTRRDDLVVTAWSCVLLRSAFLEYGFWFHPGILYEDEPWMFSVLMSLSRCGCINKILYHNRIRGNSITQSEITFAHIYGLFKGICDMREFLMDHPDCFDHEDRLSPEIQRVIKLQQITVNRYRLLAKEEKEKYLELNPDERIMFEQMIIYPASLYDRIALRTKEKAELQSNYNALLKQNAALKKDKEASKNKVNKLKESKSYRVGRTITWLPRKFRTALRKL